MTLRRIICVLFLIFACTLSSCGVGLKPPPEQYDLSTQNIEVYKTTDTENLELEVLYPTNRISDKNPTVLIIHGGGWISGSYEQFYSELEPLFADLRENGFTIVGVNYRYALNGLTWRDSLDDCEDALAYIIEHAEEYDVDTKRISMLGYSAGAHLALMTAIESKDQVKLCVSMSGPTVMTFSDTSKFYSEALEYYRDIVFEAQSSQRLISSPSSLLSKRCKSDFLMINGKSDDVVFPIHAESFCKEAESFGIKSECMLVDELTHSYQSYPKLIELSAQITERMVNNMK